MSTGTDRSSIARSEKVGYVLVVLLFWVYLIWRAAFVPLTHDEAGTLQTYVVSGNYLPFLAHWDAGNHLLITAVCRACYLLFGMQPLVLRSFSVLCFILFAIYAWRLTRWINHPFVRWCAALALLLTPFNFEFFALFRGYGPSLAFLLMALYHLIESAQERQRSHLTLTLFAMCMATYASLSLLLVYASALVLTAMMILRTDRKNT
ncbi:MAG TPA: glycosyltransferase family 39 protein, partial [Flavobacteriales bacterium]|nr:glycosyltransferase family 39 protein [Flavobacteriales bacterium]